MMKILTIVGARPQFIKVATVSRVLRSQPEITELLLHTGQHYDENMSEVFFRELLIPEPDFNLEAGSGTHAEQTGKMLKGIEEVMLVHKPDLTLVYGDTNSTLAGALAAAKLNIPVAHVEAGVRSFNRSMPEEINRIATDRISNILFAPTLTAVANLKQEGLAEITHFTGDVMFDSVLFYQNLIKDNPRKYETPGIPPAYYLATIHRAENTDDPQKLLNVVNALGNLDLPVVLPVHPRTRKILNDRKELPGNLMIIDPVGYLQMLKLTMDCVKVLTDSGGLQKEAYFLGKPCITLRNETEWLETLHDQWNILTGTAPDKIISAAKINYPDAPRRNDFGNGKAAEKIADKILSF